MICIQIRNAPHPTLTVPCTSKTNCKALITIRYVFYTTNLKIYYFNNWRNIASQDHSINNEQLKIIMLWPRYYMDNVDVQTLLVMHEFSKYMILSVSFYNIAFRKSGMHLAIMLNFRLKDSCHFYFSIYSMS